jgi:hypothetical protein
MALSCDHAECEEGGEKCIYISTCASPSSSAFLAGRQATELRQQLSIYTSVMGVTNCSMKFLIVKISAGVRTPKEITDYCQNKHVCPTCMRYQYYKLEKALEATLNAWTESGKSVFTQTLTLPNRNKSLVFKHKDLVTIWNAVGKTKRFTKLRAKYHVAQYLRITEDSLKRVNSNPHFHLTWFFAKDVSEDMMREFCSEVAALWELKSEQKGVRGAQANQQWSGPIRHSNKAYARYMAKHGYWDLSFDPLMPVKPNEGLKPLEFLRVLMAQGDAELLAVWEDYEAATRGKHRIQKSQNFMWAPQVPKRTK